MRERRYNLAVGCPDRPARPEKVTSLPADATYQSFEQAELMERVEGDVELLLDLAETFQSLHAEQLADLRASLEARDFGALGRTAHALKGSLSTLAARATARAASLEQIAKSADVEACARELAALTTELPILARELTELVARLSA